MGSQPPVPADRRAVRRRHVTHPLLESDHPPMAAKRSSSLVGITRAGLTVAVALGLTTVFAERAWLAAALVAAIAPHALVAWADRRTPSRMGNRDRHARRRLRVHALHRRPRTRLSRGFPTRASFGAYGDQLGDLSRVLRTAIVPVVGDRERPAPRTARVVGCRSDRRDRRRAGSTRRSARSDRASCCSSRRRARRRRLGVGNDHLRARRGALPRRPPSGRADRTSQLVPRPRRSAVARAGRRHPRCRRGRSRGALFAPMLPGARSAPWFDYREFGDGGEGGGLLEAETPIVSIQRQAAR